MQGGYLSPAAVSTAAWAKSSERQAGVLAQQPSASKHASRSGRAEALWHVDVVRKFASNNKDHRRAVRTQGSGDRKTTLYV